MKFKFDEYELPIKIESANLSVRNELLKPNLDAATLRSSINKFEVLAREGLLSKSWSMIQSLYQKASALEAQLEAKRRNRMQPEDLLAVLDEAHETVKKVKDSLLETATVIGGDSREGVVALLSRNTYRNGTALPKFFKDRAPATVAILYVKDPNRLKALRLQKVNTELGTDPALPPCIGPNSPNPYAELTATSEFIGTGFLVDRKIVVAAGHVLAEVRNRMGPDATQEVAWNHTAVLLAYDPNVLSYEPGEVYFAKKGYILDQHTTDGQLAKDLDVGAIVLERDFPAEVKPMPLAAATPDSAQVYSIGYPFGWSRSAGLPSQLWSLDTYRKSFPLKSINTDCPEQFVAHSCPQNEGQSGSPLIDVNSGEVVGLSCSEVTGSLPFVSEKGCSKIVPCKLENQECSPNEGRNVRAIKVLLERVRALP